MKNPDYRLTQLFTQLLHLEASETSSSLCVPLNQPVDIFPFFSIQLIMTLLCSEPTSGFPCHSEQIPKSLTLSIRPYMLWSLLPIQYYFLPLSSLISCSPATVIFLLFPENVKYLTKYPFPQSLCFSQISAYLNQSLSSDVCSSVTLSERSF